MTTHRARANDPTLLILTSVASGQKHRRLCAIAVATAVHASA
jgi:hypothetical protein